MTTVHDHTTAAPPAPDRLGGNPRRSSGAKGHPGRPRTRRVLGLLAAVAALVLVVLASIAVGAKPIPLPTVLDALLHYDPTQEDHLIVHSLRLPRTVLGLLVGVALGLAGAVMQGLTRNPLADPGILGVSAGASLAVVMAIHLAGVATLQGYVWWAFAGAAVVSVAVYALGSLGREGATPVKLALAGAALTAFVGSITSAILLIDVATLDQYRFWAVGSLAGRDGAIVEQVLPFVVVGTVVALGLGRTLNVLALGDDVARGLGQRIAVGRLLGALVVVLLVGGATAAAGPIGFVGLAVPHMARALTGPDYRWVLAVSAVLAPTLLLGADVLGRVIARPGEVQVGLMTAALGAPFFIALVRRRRLAEL
ncbi:FecCD family ABC transporter permease [Nocardioides sp.]|uniref:FecCD family ABC transporter permease n=1 Tax=Nocardioides sp. TaxID=35761 RepID=UPI003513B015